MKLSKHGRAIWELLWQYIANEDADEDYSYGMAERLCETVLPQVWDHVTQLEAGIAALKQELELKADYIKRLEKEN